MADSLLSCTWCLVVYAKDDKQFEHDEDEEDCPLRMPTFGRTFFAPKDIDSLLGANAECASITYCLRTQRESWQEWSAAIDTLICRKSLSDIQLNFSFWRGSWPTNQSPTQDIPEFQRIIRDRTGLRAVTITAEHTPSDFVRKLSASLEAQPALQYLTWACDEVPPALDSLLASGYFRQMRYLSMEFREPCLFTRDSWVLPCLESLILNCGAAVTLRLENLVSLKSANISERASGVIVHFGDNCRRLRKLSLTGDITVIGDLSLVSYLFLWSYPYTNPVIQRCKQLRELNISGSSLEPGSYCCCVVELISIPATPFLRFVAIESLFIDKLRFIGTHPSKVVSLSNVKFGSLEGLTASSICLDGSIIGFFEQFARNPAILGNPRRLSLTCSSSYTPSTDVIMALLQSKQCRRLEFLATNISLPSVPTLRRLKYLGLQNFEDFIRIASWIDHELERLAVFEDDGKLNDAVSSIRGRCKNLTVCDRLVGRSQVEDFAIEEDCLLSPTVFLFQQLGFNPVQ